MPHCIIVVPCYNEAARLDVEAFRRFAIQGHPQRFLFVDDHSTDATPAMLETLRLWDPARFDVCRLSRNMGKAEAVRHGVLRAIDQRADFVGFWDADLATPLEVIPEFCDALETSPRLQIVMGARVKLLGRAIERKALRHYLGRVFATAASLVLGLPVYDTQCGAKLFRVSEEICALFAEPLRTNWVFDVELLARFLRIAGGRQAIEGRILELPLRQWCDVAGSKVKASDFFKSFFGLLRIYWTYLRRGAAPISGHELSIPESVPETEVAAKLPEPPRSRAA